MDQNKKFLIAGGVLILIGAIIIGTSYGFWKVDKTQKLTNNLIVDCLNLELSDVTEAINLEGAHPISDREAARLNPYEFKIRNTCESTVNYSVNLEVMEIENQLKSEYVAVSFNNEPKEILNTKQMVTPIYKGDDYTAKEAYFLINDELGPNDEKNYTIKLWLDESVTNVDSMNKEFISKISISGEIKSETNLIEYLTNLESSELVEDDYGNLRYIGANPNNYVSFNNELWRIIGVMKDIENPDGTKNDKVKIIRSESIGSYSWDNKASGTGSSTSQYGSNDWSDSALQKVLNEGVYYNRASGNCPYGQNGATTSCDFSESGLTSDAIKMISSSIWNLGGVPSGANYKAIDWYTYERGEDVLDGRPTKWTGKVGLAYISDYGYATGGGEVSDRNTCLNTQMFSRDTDCKNNTWIKPAFSWSLTPSSSSKYKIFGYFGGPAGNTTSFGYVYPVVYLGFDLMIENGNNGSSGDPFVLKQVKKTKGNNNEK